MNLSKQVGWDFRNITYPTIIQVENSTPYQRLEWNRFLPCAKNDKQEKIIHKILKLGW